MDSCVVCLSTDYSTLRYKLASAASIGHVSLTFHTVSDPQESPEKRRKGGRMDDRLMGDIRKRVEGREGKGRR